MKILPRLQVLAGLALATAAPAQFIPIHPFERTLDLLVVDSTLDGVWRLRDLNQDGDFNDPLELDIYYSDTVGSIALTNPNCVVWSQTGIAYVGESSGQQVIALEDKNADGDAHDPGEHSVFFDSATNQSNVVMTSIQGMAADLLGNLFLAVSNTTSGGDDVIIRLQDANNDGDANDPGEAVVYCLIPGSKTAVGSSIPTQVRVGPDNKLYFLENGVTGNPTRGVYRLDDLNNDGDCNDNGEVQLYWDLPDRIGTQNAFYWAMALDRSGNFYVADHGNDLIYAGRDTDADNKITGTEGRIFHQGTSATWWEILMRDDGWLLVCEDQTPDRLLAFKDLNNDGDADDQGERREIYSELISSTNLTQPRAAALMRAPILTMQQASVKLGGQVNLSILTPKRNEPTILMFALKPASVSFPPFGEVGLDLTTLQVFLSATSDAKAAISHTFTVPLDTNLVRTWPFQAVAGDSWRPFLSNPVSLTVTR